MNLITLDFETYYSQDYSLSTMTTEEYVRDPRFEIIGVAVAVNNEAPEWFSAGSFDEYTAWLKRFNLRESMVLAHNTMFDGAILAWRLAQYPRFLLDTLSMASPLHGAVVGGSLKALAEHYQVGVKGTEVVTAKGKRRRDFTPAELTQYGEYCKNDVVLTRRLFLKMREQLPRRELRLIDATVRMFTEPRLWLDRVTLERHLASVVGEKQALLDQVEVSGQSLRSNPQFAELLRERGVEPPTKISPTTGKEAYAFAKQDKDFTDLLEHPDTAVQALVAARLGVKSTIEETRTQRLLGLAKRGTMPVPLLYAGAHTTWRWSGSQKLNLQNLPRGGAIRKAIMAPPGHVLVGGDLSQIEMRVNHTLAGRQASVEAFRADRELYVEFAAIRYGVAEDAVTKDQRHFGKTAHLGLGYGCGHVKFQSICRQAKVPLDLPESKEVVDLWRATYFEIPTLWREAERGIEAMARGATYRVGTGDLVVAGQLPDGTPAFLLPEGRFIRYDDLQRSRDGWSYKGRGPRKKLYGGAACLAQGTLVLTDVGWVPIERVSIQHKVFDGVEFVAHGGLLFNGHKQCVNIDGVNMTLDHRVLTNDGWQEASQLQGSNGPTIRYVDSDRAFTQRWQEMALAVPVRLWEHYDQMRGRASQDAEACRHGQLWMPNRETPKCEQYAAWDEQASSLRRVAQHVRSMSAPVASSMGQLWRAWHYRLRALARSVRALLGRHGTVVPTRADIGSHRQRGELYLRELSLGTIQSTSAQPTREYRCRPCNTLTEDGHRALDAVLSVSARTPADGADEVSISTRVYDIANAGPRHRFVVLGESGPFVVHNCENICQALARHILADQWLLLDDWLRCEAPQWRVVLQVHDELVLCGPEPGAERVADALRRVMATPPRWWPELPLAAKVGISTRFGTIEK